MPFDLIACYESGAQTFAANVTPVPDQFYTIAGDYFLVQKYAPLLVGVFHSAVSTPARCRIFQPRLRPPYDFKRSVLVGTASPWEGLTYLGGRPLPLYPNEQLSFKAINATSEATLAILFLSNGKVTQAMLDAVNPTHSLMGYSDTDCVAGTWVDATMVWDETLPEGRYAIVGMKAGFYKASGPGSGAIRLTMKENQWHPGCLASIQTGDRTLSVTDGECPVGFEYWPLMNDISFDNINLPGVQMISGIANTDLEVELLLQKTR